MFYSARHVIGGISVPSPTPFHNHLEDGNASSVVLRCYWRKRYGNTWHAPRLNVRQRRQAARAEARPAPTNFDGTRFTYNFDLTRFA